VVTIFVILPEIASLNDLNPIFAQQEPKDSNEVVSMPSVSTNNTDDHLVDNSSTDDKTDYICGDANGSNSINILDITYLMSYLFSGGPAPYIYDAGDVDSLNIITFNDISHLLCFIYHNGEEPYCPPFPDSVLPISIIDTLKIEGGIIPPEHSMVRIDLPVHIKRNIHSISLPLSFDYSYGNIICDSITGDFDDYYMGLPNYIEIIDNDNHKILININGFVDYIEPSDSEKVSTLWFTVNPSSDTQYISIDTTTYPPSNILIVSECNYPFIPVVIFDSSYIYCYDSDDDGYGDPGHIESLCPEDNCPYIYNPGQDNSDSDSLGDICDNCPNIVIIASIHLTHIRKIMMRMVLGICVISAMIRTTMVMVILDFR